MKLLILGASGLTGYKSALLGKKNNFEVYGTYNIRNMPKDIQDIGTYFGINLNKEDTLFELFQEVEPDIVLNCIALHNVDYCETHPEEAFFINADLVARIVSHCNRTRARLIQISTDYVFDGEKNSGYAETDHPNPVNVYARSKLKGEYNARRAASYSIIRPSVVYGWTPSEVMGSVSSSGKLMNFALWVLHKLKNNEELRIVMDQFTSPTLADTVALAALKVAVTQRNDLYHVGGKSCISRYEFTGKIAQTMGHSSANIKPIRSSDFDQPAKRPPNSCLDCRKIEKNLDLGLPTVDESLAIMRSQLEQESPSLLGSG